MTFTSCDRGDNRDRGTGPQCRLDDLPPFQSRPVSPLYDRVNARLNLSVFHSWPSLLKDDGSPLNLNGRCPPDAYFEPGNMRELYTFGLERQNGRYLGKKTADL